jgi:hypothetical protein
MVLYPSLTNSNVQDGQAKTRQQDVTFLVFIPCVSGHNGGSALAHAGVKQSPFRKARSVNEPSVEEEGTPLPMEVSFIFLKPPLVHTYIFQQVLLF